MPPPRMASATPYPKITASRLRAHWPAVAVIVVAALARAGVMWLYSPAVQQYYDAPRFARTAGWGFFDDYWTPAGYATFLRGLRVASNELVFTIGVQHLLGLVTGLLLAGAAKHLGVRAPWHLVAGVFVWFGGDFVFFEHVLMSETLFIFTVALTVYLSCRGLAAATGSTTWFLLSGLAASAATLVRWNGLFLLVLPPLLAATRARAWPSRAKVALLVVVPNVVLLGAYLVVSSSIGYSGTSDMNGWLLYSRVAPFLDCDQTSWDDAHPELCEATPPGQRLGPLYYSWQPASPARALFGLGPEPNNYLLRLGLDTIRHEPVAYARAVATDVVRLFFWSHEQKDGHGQLVEYYDFAYRDQGVETFIEDALGTRYDGVQVRERPQSWLLHDAQRATRVPGWAMLALAVLSTVAVVWTPRGRRAGPLLVLVVIAALWVLPILSLTWDFRYSLPGTAFLPLGALLLLPAVSARAADRAAAKARRATHDAELADADLADADPADADPADAELADAELADADLADADLADADLADAGMADGGMADAGMAGTGTTDDGARVPASRTANLPGS